MNVTKLTQYIQALPGVEGCYIASPSGGIVAKDMPALFDDEILSDVAVNCSHVLETFKSEMPSCSELQLDMELKKIFIRDLGAFILIILVNEDEQVANIRIAANVAAKRFSPSAEDESPQKSAPVKSKSLFGWSSKKETKPKKSGGGIWG